MARGLGWEDFPWEGVPHEAVWLIVLLQSMAVGRMVGLYLAGGGTALLGKLAPHGGLAAVVVG